MPRTLETQTVYGAEMPVQAYRLAWSCGHSKIVRLASLTALAPLVTMETPCPDCYTGPFANVYD